MSDPAPDSAEQPEYATGVVASKIFADFPSRAFSFLLDIGTVLLLMVPSFGFIEQQVGTAIGPIVTLLILLLYFTGFWLSPLRATPWQWLLGQRVLTKSGKPLSAIQTLLRAIVLMCLTNGMFIIYEIYDTPWVGLAGVLAFGLLFMAAITPKRQALHDLIVGSVVVRKEASSSVRIVADCVVFVVIVGMVIMTLETRHDMDLKVRVIYAINHVQALREKIQAFYTASGRLPHDTRELGAGERTGYPAGGYYQMEPGGAIRIHFTIKPELKKGDIVLYPLPSERGVGWGCRQQGKMAKRYLPGFCR